MTELIQRVKLKQQMSSKMPMSSAPAPISDCEVRDPRIRRTRQLLQGALGSLLKIKGFDEISVQDIADSATKLHINYPVLIDDNETSKPYGGIDALPTTFFIDRNGKVVAATIGLADRDEIEANIQKALGNQKAPDSQKTAGSETQAQKGQS